MEFLQSRKNKYHILLVEDNPADIRLTKEALKESSLEITLDVVMDGEAALDFLLKRKGYSDATTPLIILLDLNLPKKNGLEVLKEIKADESLKEIPVIVLTTSDAKHDITRAYQLYANCYIIKPIDFDEFSKVIQLIEAFWFRAAKLPAA
ncbi:MAG: response regulator [Bacteroidetes bacterium]|nr:response regulator [Bacteroidota bacterium]